MGKEFTLGDRIVYIFSYSYIVVVALLFLFGTIYMLSTDISDAAWGQFWWYFCLDHDAGTVVGHRSLADLQPRQAAS